MERAAQQNGSPEASSSAVKAMATASVFRDPQALSVFDTDHSEDHGRWITLGVAATGVILIVNHTFVTPIGIMPGISRQPE